MKLKNKNDGRIYRVLTESDCHGLFRIFATPLDEVVESVDEAQFVMHYRTLADFCKDWEDVED